MFDRPRFQGCEPRVFCGGCPIMGSNLQGGGSSASRISIVSGRRTHPGPGTISPPEMARRPPQLGPFNRSNLPAMNGRLLGRQAPSVEGMPMPSGTASSSPGLINSRRSYLQKPGLRRVINWPRHTGFGSEEAAGQGTPFIQETQAENGNRNSIPRPVGPSLASRRCGTRPKTHEPANKCRARALPKDQPSPRSRPGVPGYHFEGEKQ